MILCNLGAGEPQYQLVPALFEVLVNRLRTIDEQDASGDLCFIIKSDGMGKQKNMGLRTVRLVQEIHGHLISNVTHDKDKGETKGEWGQHGHTLLILVCENVPVKMFL